MASASSPPYIDILRQGPLGAYNRWTDKLNGVEMAESDYNEHIKQADEYYKKLTDKPNASSLTSSVVSMALHYFGEVGEMIEKRLNYLKNKIRGYESDPIKNNKILQKIDAVEQNKTTNKQRISAINDIISGINAQEGGREFARPGGKIRKTRKSRNSRRKGKSKKRRAR